MRTLSMTLSLLVMVPASAAPQGICEPPDLSTRPNFLVPGVRWADIVRSGQVTFETPSPTGVPIAQLDTSAFAGRYAILAVVTNGRHAGDTLQGTLELRPLPAPITRRRPGKICSATACQDTVWTTIERFALVGAADAAVARWPLAGIDRAGSRDSLSPGIEADFGRDGMLTFSLGPGIHSEDGPPRFTINEARPPQFRGWWYEGAPIDRPAGGHFCMTRLE